MIKRVAVRVKWNDSDFLVEYRISGSTASLIRAAGKDADLVMPDLPTTIDLPAHSSIETTIEIALRRTYGSAEIVFKES